MSKTVWEVKFADALRSMDLWVRAASAGSAEKRARSITRRPENREEFRGLRLRSVKHVGTLDD